MNERRWAAHFLMELLLATLIFAICASVCMWVFFEAFTTANETRDLNYALIVARNAAEVSKANGSPEEMVSYFDQQWKPSKEAEALFVLEFTKLYEQAETDLYELRVTRESGEEVVSFPVGIRK